MATAKKRKSKLNGSADSLAIALRDVVKEAAEEAAQPIQKSIASLKEATEKSVASLQQGQDYLLELVVETRDDVAALKNDVVTLRKNTQVQLAEVNKKLGKLDKRVSNLEKQNR